MIVRYIHNVAEYKQFMADGDTESGVKCKHDACSVSFNGTTTSNPDDLTDEFFPKLVVGEFWDDPNGPYYYQHHFYDLNEVGLEAVSLTLKTAVEEAQRLKDLIKQTERFETINKSDIPFVVENLKKLASSVEPEKRPDMVYSDECDCEKPDVELIEDSSNMWYHGCWVECGTCKKRTTYFSHNGDQTSGRPKAVSAWRNKEYKVRVYQFNVIMTFKTDSDMQKAYNVINEHVKLPNLCDLKKERKEI